MTIYLKKIYKNVTREKPPSCPIDYRDVHNQWKKIEKLGLGTLKNCMIYRRWDTHKIWTIVIWNGFVIIRLLQQRGGGVMNTSVQQQRWMYLTHPRTTTGVDSGPLKSGSEYFQWYQFLFANGYNLCHWAHMYFERVCVTNNRIFTSV